MIAVLHIIPAQPGDGIERQAQIPGRAHHHAAHALAGPDRTGAVVLPEPQDYGRFIAGLLVAVGVLLVGVGADVLPPCAAELPCALFELFRQLPTLDEYVRLALHTPVGAVAEAHARVRHYLRRYCAPASARRRRLAVPVGVGSRVAVHGGVAHELLNQRGQLVVLEERVKLRVNHVHGAYDPPVARVRIHRRGEQLHPVAGYARHSEERHALEEVENRRRQAVGLHTLPLLAYEEVLVHAHGVVELYALVVGEHPLVLAPHALRRELAVLLSFHCASPLLLSISLVP